MAGTELQAPCSIAWPVPTAISFQDATEVNGVIDASSLRSILRLRLHFSPELQIDSETRSEVLGDSL